MQYKKITRALLSFANNTDLQEAKSDFLKKISEGLGAQIAVICNIDWMNNSIYCESYYNQGKEIKDCLYRTFKDDSWLIAHLKMREVILCEDIDNLSKDAYLLQENLKEYNIQSFIMSPIIREGELYGFISLFFFDKRSFKGLEKSFFEFMVASLNVALELRRNTRKELNDYNQSFLYNLPFAYIHLNPLYDGGNFLLNFEIINMNSKFERIFNCNKDNLLNNKITDYISFTQSDLERIYKAIENKATIDTYLEVNGVKLELKIYSPEGKTIVLLFDKEVVDENLSNVLRYHEINTIYKNLPFGLGLFDKNGYLLTCNNYVRNAIGNNNYEELIGKNLFTRISEEKLSVLKENDSYEFVVSKLDKYFKFRVFIVFDKQKQNKYYVAVLYDDSELVLLREKLNQSQQDIDKSEQLKNIFISDMGSEIKDFIDSTKGFVGLLKRNQNSEKQDSYIDIIDENTEQLSGAINTLLKMSMLKSNLFELNIEMIDVGTFLSEVSKKYRALIKEELYFHLDNEIKGLCIKADKARLNQVITNLILNSNKHTTEGTIVLGTELKADRLSIYVKDTGCGIKTEYIENLFVPVYDIDNKSEIKLGLPISRKLTELMNGQMDIESIVGEGTKVSLTFKL